MCAAARSVSNLSFAEVGPPQIPVAGLPQAEVESAEATHPLSLGTSGSRDYRLPLRTTMTGT
jgi:hypothetical protein